ncbi:hypothetical protein V2J09_019177 [Rumex salicifolius]
MARQPISTNPWILEAIPLLVVILIVAHVFALGRESSILDSVFVDHDFGSLAPDLSPPQSTQVADDISIWLILTAPTNLSGNSSSDCASTTKPMSMVTALTAPSARCSNALAIFELAMSTSISR